ncbi:hypothetical protein PPERSA_06966 [Pseudocohnilembus persalinus]|uniref:Uncharacterized protein n=1 Tax=Pseudocohnilembus persalinus TaxID=266149 RepID=A0A0V0QYH7_PSEPJ|nr:hypothetical protein PPERSA_06966 [Pseudocohnilembus persalinus]|eukprot:KRX07351.1 hypothetical protein PPERSA_06966 [Pseudocohnilembus persalinus]
MKNSENTYGEEMSQIYSLIYNLLFPKKNDFTQLIKKYNNNKKNLNNIIVQDQNQLQSQNQDLNVNQDIQSLMNLSTYLTNNVNNGNSNSNISIQDQEQLDLNQYVEQDKFNSSENMTYFHICQNFYSMIQQIQNENSQNIKKIQELENQLDDQKQINMQQKEQLDKQNSDKDQQINELEQTISNLSQELELRAQIYQKSIERCEIEQNVIAHELDIQKKEFFGQFEPKTGEIILDNKKSTQNKIDIIYEAVQRLIQNKQVELSELQEQKSPMKKTQILSNRGSIFSSKTNISPLHRMNSSNSPKKKQSSLSLKMEQVQKIFINKSYNEDNSSSKNKSKNGDKNDSFSKSILKTSQKISEM